MITLSGYTLGGLIHESIDKYLYHGYRNRDQLPVVVKMFKSEYPRASELARLRHEYSILRELNLLGVIKTYGLERCGHGLCLILEGLDAQSLSQNLRAGALPVDTCLHIAGALADILAPLHERGILHKDIKPHNILFNTQTGAVHLIDFGISTRLPHETPQLTAPSALEGTLTYMSPEQTGRMNRSIDHRADLYSVGITLYEMLVGVPPFQSADPMELVHFHLARTPVAPHHLDARIPRSVSDLTMKLLAKAAEDRYQSARGLAADLRECLAQWQARGKVELLTLGQHDHSDILQIPQKLFGRESEVAAFLAAYTRVGEGRAELLLLTGAAGTGKSTLVAEVQSAIALRGGDLVTGKFDPLHRTVPYAAFAQAFRALVLHLLTLPGAQLLQWRAKILAASEPHGKLLTDLVAELELVIGPQPAVVSLGLAESQNRFGFLIQRFVRVFCTATHPLVLFLDDLQWADPPSLGLLRLLLTDPEAGNLLLIGSYRDTEIDDAHPLRRALHDLRNHGVVPSEIVLQPLGVASVRQLLVETLQQGESPSLNALADLMFAKTQGNPFFFMQFLRAVQQAKLLRLDPLSNDWTWDAEEIAAVPITDNVAELMASLLQKLGPETQELLARAACIGYQFDLATLAAVLGVSAPLCATKLWPALREGLVVPLSTHYRLLPSGDSAGFLHEAGVNVAYRFLHDRVQQAAYAVISPAQQQAIHLRIGRRLREQLPSDPAASVLFEVVHHLNRSAALIDAPGERIGLARLNLSAAHTAKRATAFAAALAFLQVGVTLVTAAWETDFALTFELYRERAECEYLTGDFAAANVQIEQLLGRAQTPSQRAEIVCLRMTLYVSQGRFLEGMAAGVAELKKLGIALPETPEQGLLMFRDEVLGIDQRLAGRGIKSLIDLPLMTEKDKQAGLKLMMELSPLAYQIAPPLAAVVIALQVRLSLDYGLSPLFAYGYVTYGLLLVGLLERYAEAIEHGRLAVQLVERFHAVEFACKIHFQFGMYAPHAEPLRASLESFIQAQQIGLASGDLFYASLAFSYHSLTLLRLGDPLEIVREDIDRGLDAMKRTQDGMNSAALGLLRQTVACLQGRTQGPTGLTDDDFDESRWLAQVDAMRFVAGRCLYHTYKLQLLYLHGDYPAALAMADGAEQTLASSLGMHWTTEIPFYAGLTLAQLYRTAAEAQRPALAESLQRHLARLKALAQSAPFNDQHRYLLVAAELAAGSPHPAAALELYDGAIAGARDNGFPQHEALANELCAKFHHSQGRPRVAAVYLAEARYGYERWGAHAKVNQLNRDYADLFVDSAAGTVPRGALRDPHDTTMTVAMSSQQLDVASVLRAAQAISKEIVLDKVLDQVMHIVVTNAGAQRGFLLLERDGNLWVEAEIEIEPQRVVTGLHSPASGHAGLALSIVHYVARTREPVVLANAVLDPRFAEDPYMAAARPKSVLCLALLQQGRISGVLYLENNITTNAFTHERVGLLRLLSAQAAISIENALLYANLQDATEKLRQNNETLEQQVAQRTAQLSRALAELWSEMDLASKIQTILLPKDPQIPGYEITAVMRPASNVGGDYYDIFHAAGTDWLLIGDVSGHGITAGLCMMMVQTAVRAVVRTLERDPATLRPSEVLALVNSAIYRNLSHIGRDQYMTITAFCFRDNQIYYSGQHQDILVYRAAQERVESIETSGAWLGVLPSIAGLLKEEVFCLDPGDTMLLFTDGITEAQLEKRKFLRTSGLAKLFGEVVATAAAPAAIIQHITERIVKYHTSDDMTLIAVKRQKPEVSNG